MKRVLLADKLAADVVNALAALKLDVINRPELSAEELPTAVEDVDILVVRSTKVTDKTIQAGKGLGLIVRAGAGVNTIDVEAASRRGIYVANCPGVNSAAVAELAIGLLIAADRRIAHACGDLRDGRWRKKEYSQARGLKGRTLGLVGFGSIGKAVAQRALALEMHVIAWSRSLTKEEGARYGVEAVSNPMEVARRADAVSIHLALTPETKHLVNQAFLESMAPGTILVNTSRGELVDTAALRAAIAQRKLKVACDVFENEPAAGEAEMPDVDLMQQLTATPHIGASTDQTSEAIGRAVVQIVRSYVEQGHVADAVNILEKTPASHHLLVRHYNRVGVLATILDGLREEQINVEEMQNRIFARAAAAVCTLALDSPPSEKFLHTLRADENILQVALNEVD